MTKKLAKHKQVPVPVPRTGTNADILNYLNYYCDPNNPFDFAVLIKGPWGAGKTFFIKAFLQQLRARKDGFKALYVSLYGVTSTQQIDDQLFKEMHPVLASKGAKLAATVLKGVLKAGLKIDLDGHDKAEVETQIPSIKLNDYMITPHSCVVVFDDLERCSMPLADVMGYINSFVEHDDIKAIIIANEDEIIIREHPTDAQKQVEKKYAQIKEKLIGRTLEIFVQTKQALNDFIQLVKTEKVRGFLEKNVDDILLLHQQSITNNLRILKQSLWDFERLANCFTEDHWKNEEAIKAILQIVLILCFEIKIGRVTSNDLGDVLRSKIVRHFETRKTGQESVADKLDKQYPQVELDKKFLDADTLKCLIFDGQVDPAIVQKQLNESQYYAPPGTEPAWKVVCDGWRRLDKEFKEAVTEVERQFKLREFEVAGELFLIFGIRLFLHDVGAIIKSKATIVAECERYLDALLRVGKIKPLYEEGSGLGPFSSWGGYGFPNAEDPEFARLREKYNKVVEAATAKRLPEDGKELLALMATDQTKYIRQLCPNDVERAVFYDIPIFAYISPETFVRAVLALHPEQQGTIFSAFKSRYDSGMLGGALKIEKPWLASISALFRKRIKRLGTMSRYRLESLLRSHVEIFLK